MNIHLEINKISNEPLYLQLKNYFKHAIAENFYTEGQQLPTEELLCSFYNISRPVVRRAYQSLIDEGIIVRHQGRGTFVKRNLFLSNFLFQSNNKSYLKELNYNHSSRLLMLDCVNRVDIPSLLDEKYDSFYNIKKVTYADRLPIIFENYYFPKSLYPDLPDMISGSNEIEAIFLERFKNDEVVAHLQINVIGADDFNLALFNSEKGDAMFKFIFFHRFSNNELCFHKISYFPGSRHLIEMKAD